MSTLAQFYNDHCVKQLNKEPTKAVWKLVLSHVWMHLQDLEALQVDICPPPEATDASSLASSVSLKITPI